MRKLFFFGVFLLLSLLVTWPLLLHLNNYIIDANDGLLITWIQNWWLHIISLRGNIFFPYHATLAFSDFHIVESILAAPFVFLTHEPLAAFNVNLILGLALTALSTYLLVRFLTKKEPVSFLAGVLMAFSTIHLNYMAHPQIFHLWLIIFPILFLLQKKIKLYILFFVFASINSPLNFYFLLFLTVIYRKNFRWSIVAAGISAIFLLPYFLVSRQFGYTRPITDAINNSLQFPDLMNVSVFSRLGDIIPYQPGTPAYPGVVFLVLVALALRKFKESMWWWIAGISFILALGPALHVYRNTVHIGPIPAIPLPYTIFYYLVPGFSGFRTPSRWIILTAFALVVAIAIYFAKRITWKWAIALSAMVILEANIPFKYYQVPSVSQFPPEQVWLKNNYPGAPIIQFPIYGWWDNPGVETETLREYYSTIHLHPMVNGYSGFSPKEWEEKVKWLQKNFPDGETVGYLRNLGIRLVLAPSDWNITSVQNELELVASFPKTNVYALNSRSQN